VSDTINYNNGTTEFPCDQATISVDINIGTGNRNIVVGDGSAAEDLVISGAISGGAITKQGAGTLVLSGATNYSGNTKIDAGTLTLSNSATPANANPNNDASTVTVATTGATLNLTYTGTDKVNSLVIGTTAQPTNTIYGKVGSAPPIVGIPQITGDGTITVGTPVTDPYILWAGPGVNFDADANNDGVENGLAWFLGAPNKNANATGLLPKPSQNTGALALEFDCLDATARGGAVFQVQYSNDLDAWAGTDVPGTVGTFTTGIVDFVVTDPEPVGGLLKVVATIPVDEAPAGKLFGRLKGEK
jgi:autotransporter-associated beta strand protein